MESQSCEFFSHSVDLWVHATPKASHATPRTSIDAGLTRLWNRDVAEHAREAEYEVVEWLAGVSFPLARAYAAYVVEYFRLRSQGEDVDAVADNHRTRLSRLWRELKAQWYGNEGLAKEASRRYIPYLCRCGTLLSDEDVPR
jgi:hypothetical protein